MQKKEKELAKYENSSFISEIQKCKSNFEHHKNTTDEVQEHEEQSSNPENENVENEIEILEVVKERMNDEILLNVNEETVPSDTFVNNENNEHDSGEAEESIGEIDNEWYTFVKDAKTIVPETEAPVQEKEFYLETEPTSSYENKDDRHVTEDNENDEDKSLKEVDNKWYAFVAFDKKQDLETGMALESKEIVDKQAIKRPYQCTFCRKAFQNTGNLKIHERIHTGEVPFECKSCKKSFKEKGNLIRHERIHTGEVPYECKTCKKRFNQTSTLKIHERIHTGENPYECKTCNTRFKQQAHLKLHEKQHER